MSGHWLSGIKLQSCDRILGLDGGRDPGLMVRLRSGRSSWQATRGSFRTPSCISVPAPLRLSIDLEPVTQVGADGG